MASRSIPIVRRLIAGVLLAGLLSLVLATRTHAGQPLRVVASFSVLADMAGVLGGDHVEVVELVPRGGDAHTFEPSPQTMQRLARAQLLVSNGLGFESWLPRLLKSANYQGEQVVASHGVRPRPLMADADAHTESAHGHDGHEHEGKWDPHAWHDLKNGMAYARNISRALSDLDPDHAPYYQARLLHYIEEMEALDARLLTTFEALPACCRHAVTAHDAFAYFGQAYGLTFITAAGLSGEAEPSAKDVARLVDLARSHDRVGLFTETGSNPNLMRQLALETSAPLGGPLYADTLAPEGEPAGTYLGMVDWNASQIMQILKPD